MRQGIDPRENLRQRIVLSQLTSAWTQALPGAAAPSPAASTPGKAPDASCSIGHYEPPRRRLQSARRCPPDAPRLRADTGPKSRACQAPPARRASTRRLAQEPNPRRQYASAISSRYGRRRAFRPASPRARRRTFSYSRRARRAQASASPARQPVAAVNARKQRVVDRARPLAAADCHERRLGGIESQARERPLRATASVGAQHERERRSAGISIARRCRRAAALRPTSRQRSARAAAFVKPGASIGFEQHDRRAREPAPASGCARRARPESRRSRRSRRRDRGAREAKNARLCSVPMTLRAACAKQHRTIDAAAARELATVWSG